MTTAYNIPSLAKANELRIARANTRKAIKAGALDPAQVIREADDGVKVTYILESIPRMGRQSARRLLDHFGIEGEPTLGENRNPDTYPLADADRESIARAVESGRKQLKVVA